MASNSTLTKQKTNSYFIVTKKLKFSISKSKKPFKSQPKKSNIVCSLCYRNTNTETFIPTSKCIVCGENYHQNCAELFYKFQISNSLVSKENSLLVNNDILSRCLQCQTLKTDVENDVKIEILNCIFCNLQLDKMNKKIPFNLLYF